MQLYYLTCTCLTCLFLKMTIEMSFLRASDGCAPTTLVKNSRDSTFKILSEYFQNYIGFDFQSLINWSMKSL